MGDARPQLSDWRDNQFHSARIQKLRHGRRSVSCRPHYDGRMPPRHAYWTILIDDQPTAFRAHDPEELLPTLNRLREKNETAVMKWFERGQLFDSRDAARDAGLGRGERRWEGPRPERDSEGGRSERPEGKRSDRPEGERRERAAKPRPRGDTWRPGGEHRDPRQKYQDAKKAKWTRFKENIRERHERRQRRDDELPPDSFSPPHGDPLRGPARPRDPADRPEDRRGTPSRPHGDALRSRPPREEWRDEEAPRRRDEGERERAPRDESSGDRREGWPPKGPSADRRGGQPESRGGWSSQSRGEGGQRSWSDKPRGDKRPWSGKPGGDRGGWGSKPPGDRKPRGDRDTRPWGGKPAGDRDRKPWDSKPTGDRERRPWGAKPTGDRERRPWGAKPAGDRERRPFGGKPDGPREDRGYRPKPAGDRPYRPKPAGRDEPRASGSTRYDKSDHPRGPKPGGDGARRSWGSKPPSGPSRKPGSAKPGSRPPKRRRDDDE